MHPSVGRLLLRSPVSSLEQALDRADPTPSGRGAGTFTSGKTLKNLILTRRAIGAAKALLEDPLPCSHIDPHSIQDYESTHSLHPNIDDQQTTIIIVTQKMSKPSIDLRNYYHGDQNQQTMLVPVVRGRDCIVLYIWDYAAGRYQVPCESYLSTQY